MKQDYKPELEKFSKELESLVRERAELDRKIHRVRQIIQGISEMAGISPDAALGSLTEYENRGLTNGIRAVIQAIGGQLTAAELRQALIASGYDLSEYANASSVINTVLNRLAAKGNVKKDLAKRDGSTVVTYKWVGKKENRTLADLR
ncbi:MAG TPA: hypothetical protein VI685_24560 [Candidatus Angelobacter sp.]